MRDLGREVQLIEETYLATITESAWVSNVPLLEIQIAGLANMPHLCFVELDLQDHHPITAGDATKQYDISKEYPLYYQFRNRDIHLGTMRVRFSLENAGFSYFGKFSYLLMIQALTVFFVSILTFFLFYDLVGRHLVKMARFTDEINLNNLDVPLVLDDPYPDNTQEDELSGLMNSINFMRNNLLRDIAKREEAEEALRISEERFQLAMRGANDGLWDWNLLTDEVYYSPRWKSMLGYAEDELESHLDTWKRLTHPDDVEPTLAFIRDYLAGPRDKYEAEFRMRHKDGGYRHILSRGFLVDDAQGRHVRLVGTHVDITERKAAERKLQESEEYSRTILDTVDDGFIIVDRDYRIITANKAFCDQLSLPVDQVVGKHCYAVSHLTERPCFEMGEACAVREVFMTGNHCTATHKHVTRDGEKVFVESKAFPNIDQTGHVVSAIETIRNISERHLLEAERLKTQKLESIGVLAGGIAHDFNNILAAILGNINLALLNETLEDDTRKLLTEAEKASLRARDLTQQLLTFARGGEPVKELSALEKIIRDSATFALHGTNVACRFDIPGDLWLAEIDRGQIGQVIQNIVLNASQAMPDGGVITIRCENFSSVGGKAMPHEQKKRFVAVHIQDNGIGIPENIIEKIFDPYFSTKQKGSGLGLAITHSIVSKHGGHITVETTPGAGTTFTVYLPASDQKTIAGETTRTAGKATQKARILVMDDDEQIRNLAHTMLNRMGHEVVLAKDGSEAVRMYQGALDSGKPIDLAIMDLTIPGGMGGKEAVQKIIAINPQAKVLVSSGYSTDPIMASFGEHGFCGALVKPYRSMDLANIISKVQNEPANPEPDR